MATGVEIRGTESGDGSSVLTRGALELVAELHERFEERRRELIQARGVRACAIAGGAKPGFLEETAAMRKQEWSVAEAPPDLDRRWAEITGPVDRKMMINALNSGANVFMADLEDALSPSWTNVVQGQINLVDAVRKRIDFRNPDGREYSLNPEVATLLVRPRGWHLQEKHVHVHGEPASASLFDFGLYFYHNAKELLSRGTGPYFYLPKLESHLEARLWNDVFCAAQDALGIPRGTIRATVLIETVLAAFEMEEILYELREHSSGLNAGRWDYIFSVIKKFAFREDLSLPDRGQITMTVPFMRAYTELLVKTCHHRGAHAIGGMAAFIPSRRDEEVNRIALTKVREDKEREAADGFDGSWVAHPDLVPVCREVFERVLNGANNQKQRLRDDVSISPEQLIDLTVPGGTLTEEGVRNNVSVGVQYLRSWLEGNGAAAINNLMEDAATAEISRAQLWQWIHREAKLEDGRKMTPQLYEQIRDEEVEKLGGRNQGRLALATELLDRLALDDEFQEFLTLDAYRHLE